jgi:hypothetical protein
MKFNTATTTVATALLAGSAQALFGKPPPQPRPHVIDDFAWTKPFAADGEVAGFDTVCESSKTFDGLQYTLTDLLERQPFGLKPWSAGLKKFFSGKEYPGGWSGVDRHGLDRQLLLMDYDAIPVTIREWIEEEQRSGGTLDNLFAVLDKPKEEDEIIKAVYTFPAVNEIDRATDSDRVVIFAPGALYHVLPLWVAAESKCQDDFVDLSKYKTKPEEGGVVAWVDHKQPKEHKMTFKIQARTIRSKEAEQEAPKEAATEEDASKSEL